MPCRCCIVEILDGNSGFASLRRFCFAGTVHSPWGSIFLRKVTEKETAETADALGGAERMITTMELLGKGAQNPVEEMAVADGFAKAKETDFAKLYRMCLPVKVMRVLALVVVLTIGAGFMPVQRDAEAEAYAKAQLERIEQVKAEETPELSKEEKSRFQAAVMPMYGKYCSDYVDMIDRIVAEGR